MPIYNLNDQITNEVQAVTEVNANTYHLLVPDNGPFLRQDFAIQFVTDLAVVIPLVESVDYSFAMLHITATRSLGQVIYGGICIASVRTGGHYEVTYKTLGSDWTISKETIYNTLFTQAYNPRLVSWDQVVGALAYFPPTIHTEPITDFTQYADLISTLNYLTSAVLASGINNLHLTDVLAHTDIRALIIDEVSNRNSAISNKLGVLNNKLATEHAVRKVLSANNIQYFDGTSGAVSANGTTEYLYLNILGGEDALAITLPPDPFDNQKLTVFTFSDVTGVTWVSDKGVVGPVTSITNSRPITWLYHAGTGSWYKVTPSNIEASIAAAISALAVNATTIDGARKQLNGSNIQIFSGVSGTVIADGTTEHLLLSGEDITSLTIRLPENPVHGQNFSICTLFDVTGITCTAVGASVREPISSITPQTPVSWIYAHPFLSWVKTVVNEAASAVPAASLTVAGIVELATNAEVAAGTDTQRAVTPAGLTAAIGGIVPGATLTAMGIVELATGAETIAGDDEVRAVTPAGLKAAITNSSSVMKPGTVFFTGSVIAPAGSLIADGSVLLRSAYPELFAQISTTFSLYIEDGAWITANPLHFHIPDLRGQFIRGVNPESYGFDVNRLLGSFQDDEFKAHEHDIVYGPYGAGTELGGHFINESTIATTPLDTTSIKSTGGWETRPRNVALTACIKY